MQFLNSCWKGMDSNSIDVWNIIETVRKHTCLVKKCISSLPATEKETLTIIPSEYITHITLQSLTEYFTELPTKSDDSYHFACIVEVLHILYINIINKINVSNAASSDSLLQEVVKLSSKCLQQPDLLCPIPLDVECGSSEKYESTVQANISLTFSCFYLYLDILFTEIKNNGDIHVNKSESRITSLEDPSANQKIILKKTTAMAVMIASSRVGDQPWTNVDLKKICYDVIRCIKICSKYDSYSNLLSGIYPENSLVLFPNGLLGNVLDELMIWCTKEKWKKNVPCIHALLWCLKKVKYPHLGKHISKIVPALLLLTDDHAIDHKLLGILSLNHLIVNVNPADLRLYNYSAVIYDALYLQLFSNQHQIYEVTIMCLLQLLPVLESKPHVISGVKYSQWDTCFEKIMQNIDLSSKADTELVLLKGMPDFIDKMGASIIKHFDKIIDLIGFPIQGAGGDLAKKRLYHLNILSASIKVCWPVVKTYQSKLMKIVLRMLIDLSCESKDGCSTMKELLEDNICHVLLLMKLSCGENVKEALTSILKTNLDAQFDPVKCVIKKVLTTDGDIVEL